MQITFSEVNQWGKFSVIIEGVGEIKNCKHMKSDKYEFIAFPTRKQIDKDGNAVKDAKTGKDKYISDFFFTKEFEAKVLAAFKGNGADLDEQDIPF